MRSRKVLFFVV